MQFYCSSESKNPARAETKAVNLLPQKQEINQILVAALGYCRKGLSVIPLQHKGKRPLIEWTEYQTITATEQEITEWYARCREANIGIVTGTISGIYVLDVDAPDGIATLKRERLQIPPTLTAKTGGGGYHYIFKHPGGIVRNFTRKLPGIDLRGDGGYIVAPPSIHPNGNIYEWVLREPPADLPEWLLNVIVREAAGTAKTQPGRWLELVTQGTTKGERNTSVAALAGHLLRRYIDPYLVLELLLMWNEARCKPPLPGEEVKRTVDSVAKAEARRRGVSA
jgi:hypothetical protein